MNTILSKFNTPHEAVDFSKIKNSDFLPALKEAVAYAEAEIAKIKERRHHPSFETVMIPFEEASGNVELVLSIFFNLHGAASNAEIQAIAKEFSPITSKFQNDVLLDKKLFEEVKYVYEHDRNKLTNNEDKTLLEKAYKSFVRNGAMLSDEKKTKLREIDEKLARLSLEFGDHVLAETNKFFHTVKDHKDLAGIPEDTLAGAKELAVQKGEPNAWIFSLQMPSYMPVVTYADNRALRETMSKAMLSRCFKGDENDNQKIIREIVTLRHERAKILSYESHAQFVLEERMAEKPQKVFDFIEEMYKHAKPAYDREHKELLEFVKKSSGPEKIERWDYAYYAEKLKMELYAFDDEMLRPYFKLENVIDGVFQVAKKLFDLDFKQVNNIPLYHPDVMTYEVHSSGKFIGLFYADFFPRDSKRPGAWMTQFKSQKKNHRPHVSIVCNFTKSTKDKPSLITHDEVRTLFHEFGHALHGLLSDINYASLSGPNVYWDFVELPSQIMENWAQEKECLDLFARHYETGEKMPDDLMAKLHRASTYHEGRMTMRQLGLAHVDLEWHTCDPFSLPDVGGLESTILKRYDLMPPTLNSSISTSFSHIFSGGYDSGYYSYKWAEVLDADAFEFFKEKGLFNREVADRFKNHILSKGGSEHPMHLYKKFRGHEPKVQPLLKRAGLL